MIEKVVDDSPRLRAGALLLRVPDPADAWSLAMAGTDPDIAARLPYLPRSEDESLRWIAAPGTRLVVTTGTEVIGGLELPEVRPGTAELRFWVLPVARGRGVASTAVRAVTDWALPARAARLELITGVTDLAAQRVALRAGFTREGVRRAGRLRPDGTRTDEVVWSRLAEDPPGPRRRPLPDLPRGAPGNALGGMLSDGIVTLRPLGPDDADDLFELLNLPDVARRQVPPGPAGWAQVTRRCAHAGADWLAGTRGDCSMRDAATGAFAGEISLSPDPLSGEAWIGYSMLPAWRGRGFTQAAVRLLSGWALDVGFPRLCAGTMPDNVASQRVLEATGFTFEGVRRAELPGHAGSRNDDHVYVRLGRRHDPR